MMTFLEPLLNLFDELIVFVCFVFVVAYAGVHVIDKVMPRGDASQRVGQWFLTIYENVVHTSIVEHAHKRGYKDFKYMLYGDKISGALSFQFHISQRGRVRFDIAS